MATIGDLWHQVVEAPHDLGLRLVLADALIEQGDARGELIALQCRGADANVLVDRELCAHTENNYERVIELIAQNWNAWLGPLARVLVRQGSTFHDGMLANVQVTSDSHERDDFAQLAKHHELCAVRRIRPHKMRSDLYATFLANLVHDPDTVEITAPHVIRAIRERRTSWRIRCLYYGGYWVTRSDESYVLTAELERLGQLAPGLEVIEVGPNWGIGEELAAIAPRLPQLFPQLRTLRLGDVHLGWVGDHEATLRALPFVVID